MWSLAAQQSRFGGRQRHQVNPTSAGQVAVVIVVIVLQVFLGIIVVNKCGTVEHKREDFQKGSSVFSLYTREHSQPKQSQCACEEEDSDNELNDLINKQDQKNTQNNNKIQNTKYHIVTVVQPAIYMEWQVWILYYNIQKLKQKYPESSLGGFTRLLVAEEGDKWVNQIPTFLVSPADNEEIRQYKLILRPLAIQAFLESEKIEEKYLLHVDSDYVPLYPLNIQVDYNQQAKDFEPISFEYSYILDQQRIDILERFNDRGVKDLGDKIQGIAGAPALMSLDQWREFCDLWYDIQIRLQKDEEAKSTFGWIMDMAAFALTATQLKGGQIQFQIRPNFLLHPPYDDQLRIPTCYPYQDDCDDYQMGIFFHYTYSMKFNLLDTTNGRQTVAASPWEFNKRNYLDEYPTKIDPGPPLLSSTIRTMIKLMNEALEHMPLID
eukprot:TRINITY_DN4442_c0_g1_i3.p1 TRINITY_DN4442_c0_g1~~TRINITY_DN4442_c0_g1_i3.p1  ORF type:complete len:436 (+),score=45.77 TRINITY_DN4442_c0_g1_i3:43-1350(+)